MTKVLTNANELRDIRPPVEIANYWLWVALGVWLLIALAVIIVVWRQCAKWGVPAVKVPMIPAHIRAKQKLEAALAHLAEAKLFCTLVSDTTRHYLEERFDFHAPDRTTEEFLHELRGTKK